MEPLSPTAQKFVLHWGEMGTRWGINRTVAQVHALIYISPKPLTAEEITDALSVARSNVSNCLRELQGWRIIRVVHVLGDRRDHYESLKDVWEMFQIILDERKRRELDPTIAMLRECVEESKTAATKDRQTQEKLQALLEFFETMVACYQEVSRMPAATFVKFVKIRDKVKKLLGVGAK